MSEFEWKYWKTPTPSQGEYPGGVANLGELAINRRRGQSLAKSKGVIVSNTS